MRPAYFDYIGIDYVPDGNSMLVGFNCFTFARFFREKEFGLHTPDVAGINVEDVRSVEAFIERARHEWPFKEVLTPADGDLVLLGNNGRFFHVGVYCEGVVVHCQRAVQSGVKIIAKRKLGLLWDSVKYYRDKGR